MQPGDREEIRRLVMLLAGALLLGFSLGHPTELLLVTTACYLVWTLRRLSRLRDWVESRMKDAPPEFDATLGEITDALTRGQRRDRRRQQQFRYRLSRFALMTEALEEGVLTLDSDLAISWWNPAAGALLGLEARDRGNAANNIIRDPMFVEFIHLAEFEAPLNILSPRRADQTLSITAAKFGNSEIVLVVSDISEIRARGELQREFVGNLSHELRTPLTVLRGYIETLGDTLENLTPGVERSFQQMGQQVTRMESLADDLVQLAALESVDYQREFSEINLAELLSDVCTEVAQLSKGLHQIELSCGADRWLRGRSRELYSAFSNLVFNAVLHNPEGGKVDVVVEEIGKSLRVSVCDDGRGIDPLHLDRLTERFYRGDSDRNRATGGAGLGLAIVKHVLEQHDATLTISNLIGGGAGFTCHFPLTGSGSSVQVKE